MSRARRPSAAAAPEIAWTEQALEDLREIDDYIAAENPVAAARWVGV